MNEEIARPKKRNRLKAAFLAQDYEYCREIARATGFCESTIFSVLRGYRFPSGAVQHAMARVLGINIRELKELL